MPDYPIGYEPISTVAVLTNPRSGVASARHATERALERFNQRGVQAVAFTGMTADGNQTLIKQALEDPDFDALVVCGGDGMINLALQELAGTGIPLGIIPAGSGNDTARYFRLPLDPEAAAEVIADGFVTTADLGVITEHTGKRRYFGTMLGCSFDAYANQRAEQYSWPRGRKKFTAAILRELATPSYHTFKLELEGARPVPFLSEKANSRRIARDGEIPEDGRITIERRLALVTFGNTRTYGGGIVACPAADHRDGLLDLTLGEVAPRHQWLRHLADYAAGNHDDVPMVSSYRVKKAHITSSGMTAPVCSDGDSGPRLPLTVETAEAAIRYIVPAP